MQWFNTKEVEKSLDFFLCFDKGMKKINISGTHSSKSWSICQMVCLICNDILDGRATATAYKYSFWYVRM